VEFVGIFRSLGVYVLRIRKMRDFVGWASFETFQSFGGICKAPDERVVFVWRCLAIGLMSIGWGVVVFVKKENFLICDDSAGFDEVDVAADVFVGEDFGDGFFVVFHLDGVAFF